MKNLPKNYRVKRTEIIGNCYITEIEPDFKNGDWAVCADTFFLIKDGYDCHCAIWGEKLLLGIEIKNGTELRKATLNESAKCFEILKKKHYIWNGKRLVKRWRAEKFGTYYYLDTNFEVKQGVEFYFHTDNKLFNSGNYFQTKEQAEKLKALIEHQIFNKHII